MAKKKIAIVVQRYGLEVNGGAELHARMVAEKLAAMYDVTVLTSRALDYITWKPHYPAGETTVNGIRVIRFHNTERVEGDPQRYLDRKFRGRHIPQKIYRWIGKPDWWIKLVPSAAITDKDGEKWLTLQGPGMPTLAEYIDAHRNTFDAFIFFSAIYYPAAMGILTVPHKSIVVPTMHDERPAYYPIYQKVMQSAKWLMFNTMAEQRFCEQMFPIENNNKRIVAVGIDPVDNTIDSSVPARFGINDEYLIYIGRIDTAKGCDIMIRYFTQYVHETNTSLKLVLVGKRVMDVQDHPSVIFTGFVSDEQKEQLLKQAQALVIPSIYESLSLVLLESFACHVPVVANGGAEVLKDHIDISKGGWYFNSYDDFKEIVHQIITDKEGNNIKGTAGYEYVMANYTWDAVLHQFEEAIEDVSKSENLQHIKKL
jgi:glycosyltransferase involved in cell wall biosynthesis